MKKVVLFILLAVFLCGCSASNSTNNDNEKIKSDKSKDDSDTYDEETKEISSTSIKENDVVVFEDPNFERYIRSYLGKSTEEAITRKELAEITELVIDRRFIEIDYSNISTQKLLTLLRMDLTDLKYFSNLTKLDIQNQIGDLFYSLDAIGYCTKLTELSFCYNFSSYNPYIPFHTFSNNYFADVRGYKTLYSILEKLTDLKKLDLGYTLPDNILQEIQSKAPNVMIVNSNEYENSTLYENYSKLIKSVIELDSIPTDITVINVLLDVGVDINEALKKISSFENLKILRILTKDKDVAEVNLNPLTSLSNLEELVIGLNEYGKNKAILKGDSLETMQNLKYLSLIRLDVKDEEISKLTNLKSLNLAFCNINDVNFLSSCNNLYQLKLVCNEVTHEDEEKMINSTQQGLKSQTKIQYLTNLLTREFPNNCSDLFEGMTELKDFTSYQGGREDSFQNYNFKNCKNLKKLVISYVGSTIDSACDMSMLQGLTKLETLWLPHYKSYQNEETLFELKNLQFFKCELDTEHDVDKIKQTNRFSSILIKLPKISAVSYKVVIRLAGQNLANNYPELDEISCKALYNEGIYEEYYGALNFVKGIQNNNKR